MLKSTLLGAVAAATLLVTGGAIAPVQAEDLKEFRIGILGGENEADRLRNFQCMTEKLPKSASDSISKIMEVLIYGEYNLFHLLFGKLWIFQDTDQGSHSAKSCRKSTKAITAKIYSITTLKL